MKILIFKEKDGFPIKLEWLNHLTIFNEKILLDDFQKDTDPQCMNYPNLHIEDKDMHSFENISFTSSFSQEIVTFHNNLYVNDSLFDMFFEIDDKKCNIGKANK